MSETEPKRKRRGRARLTGEHYTHRYLWTVAETLRERGGAEDAGDAHPLLASSLFVYLAVEALRQPDRLHRSQFQKAHSPRTRRTFR